MISLTDTVSRTDYQDRDSRELAPRPYLYLILDADRPMESSVRYSLGECDQVRLGRARERTFGFYTEESQWVVAIGVADSRVSTQHAQLTFRGGRWVLEDLNSKNGTFLDGVRVGRVGLRDGSIIEIGHTFFLFRSSVMARGGEPEAVDTAHAQAPISDLQTLNVRLEQDLSSLADVAVANGEIQVFGESGTGKELVARAVHECSGRAGDFVAVNCGALPDQLVEAELFGHRKGAFSGATDDRTGFVRAAEGGTLLLDEIGDLPLAVQATLLRVLQEREVVPLGSSAPVRVDFRLVAATHFDLDEMVEKKEFRSDLLGRISGFRITLPPLRKRREDMGILIRALLRRRAPDQCDDVTFAFATIRSLLLYEWPRNIRELEKVLVTALALAKGEPIAPEHLPDELAQAGRRSQPGTSTSSGKLSSKVEEDEDLLQRLSGLLTEHNGNVSAVAREMGATRTQIHRWAKRFGINLESFR